MIEDNASELDQVIRDMAPSVSSSIMTMVPVLTSKLVKATRDDAGL